jgi:excisionase family DNA binding protein
MRRGISGRLLTTRDVADRLGVSPETVLRRWRAGEIPGYRLASNVLRFEPADIESYLNARRVCNATQEGVSSSSSVSDLTTDG